MSSIISGSESLWGYYLLSLVLLVFSDNGGAGGLNINTKTSSGGGN